MTAEFTILRTAAETAASLHRQIASMATRGMTDRLLLRYAETIRCRLERDLDRHTDQDELDRIDQTIQFTANTAPFDHDPHAA